MTEEKPYLLDTGGIRGIEHYERIMAQGKRNEMEALFNYKMDEFIKTGKREGTIKVLNEYAQVLNPNIPEEKENVLNLATNNFKDEKLLDYILEEISKKHLEDNNLKMTLFLTYVSGLLKNPKRRQSFQITSKTAEGKDNLQNSCLMHLPKESFLFLTSATQATIEDDVKNYPILAISEINLFRDFGANKGLLEVVKQKIEGGTTAIKKDLRTNNKTLRFEKGEQGTVTFGTTEAESDEELGTRLMKGTIVSTPKKIKIVNDNTLNYFSNEEKILSDTQEKDSWIRKGLTSFWENKEQYEVVIPYAKFLSEKIEGKELFDSSDARSQRDIKRLLSLTCAMTFLFQEQRNKKEVNGQKFLISEPKDFINTLKYTNEFFNQTYAGMDLRVNNALKFIESFGKNTWIDKLEIQEHLGIKHRDTINKYLWELEQKGFIERSKGVQLNERFALNTYKGNHIYYTSVQRAFNKCLISVQLDKLKEFLEERSVQISVQNEQNIPNVEENNGDSIKKGILEGEIERLKLNTLAQFSEEEIKKAGYTKEQLQEILE
jgi:hypothetical protein